jgi:hypothetical protein
MLKFSVFWIATRPSQMPSFLPVEFGVPPGVDVNEKPCVFQRLNSTASAVFQANSKRIHSHRRRAPASKRKSGSFFQAWHQWVLLSVEYKNSHIVV